MLWRMTVRSCGVQRCKAKSQKLSRFNERPRTFWSHAWYVCSKHFVSRTRFAELNGFDCLNYLKVDVPKHCCSCFFVPGNRGGSLTPRLFHSLPKLVLFIEKRTFRAVTGSRALQTSSVLHGYHGNAVMCVGNDVMDYYSRCCALCAIKTVFGCCSFIDSFWQQENICWRWSKRWEDSSFCSQVHTWHVHKAITNHSLTDVNV